MAGAEPDYAVAGMHVLAPLIEAGLRVDHGIEGVVADPMPGVDVRGQQFWNELPKSVEGAALFPDNPNPTKYGAAVPEDTAPELEDCSVPLTQAHVGVGTSLIILWVFAVSAIQTIVMPSTRRLARMRRFRCCDQHGHDFEFCAFGDPVVYPPGAPQTTHPNAEALRADVKAAAEQGRQLVVMLDITKSDLEQMYYARTSAPYVCFPAHAITATFVSWLVDVLGQGV